MYLHFIPSSKGLQSMGFGNIQVSSASALHMEPLSFSSSYTPVRSITIFQMLFTPQAPPQQFPHAHTFPPPPCIPLSSANYTSHKHCWVTCKWHMFIFSSLPNINFSPNKYTEGTGKAKQEVLPFDGRLCFVCREENVPITAPIAKATREFLGRIYFG